jgi:hypothetical protein
LPDDKPTTPVQVVQERRTELRLLGDLLLGRASLVRDVTPIERQRADVRGVLGLLADLKGRRITKRDFVPTLAPRKNLDRSQREIALSMACVLLIILDVRHK